MLKTFTPILDQPALYELATAIVECPPSRLQFAAQRWASASGGQYTTQDVLSEMALTLIQHAPQLIGQSTAYALRRCEWHARHLATGGRTYRHYCPEMPTFTDDEGDDYDLSESLVDPNTPTPEDLLIEHEEQAERAELVEQVRERLGRVGRRAFDGLLNHQRPSEIADQHGLSRAAISCGMQAIRQAAAQVQVQPQLPF